MGNENSNSSTMNQDKKHEPTTKQPGPGPTQTKSFDDQNEEEMKDSDKAYNQPTGALALENGGNGDEQSFDLFSTRKPKDFTAGLSSGLKNVGKGIGVGLATAVAAPIVGARDGGVLGFTKGVGVGLVSAVAFSVAGVGTGLYQTVRGAINTKEAIQKSKENQEWDHKNREWYTYNLQKEAEHILNMKEEDFLKPQQEKIKVDVKDTAYYDLLGIPSNASQSDIKRAYYKKARLLHPDKHPNEAEKYHKLFQDLSTAYQILSDPKLREKYDCHGVDGMEKDDIGALESSVFFQLMFGSEKFDDYVGELQLTQMMNTGIDAMQKVEEEKDEEENSALFEGMFVNDAASEFRQRKREVLCAVKLAARLDAFIDDPNGFKGKLEEEAMDLSRNAVGATLLKVIGYVYMEQSTKILGFEHSVAAGLGLTEMKRKGHAIANQARMMHSAYKTYKTAKKLDGKNDDDDTKPMIEKVMDDTKPMMRIIETLWNYTVIDVEKTLWSVCHKLDKDSSVSMEVREQRARRLYEMGMIFDSKGVDAKEGLSAFEQQMKEGLEMNKNIQKHRKQQEEQQQSSDV